MIDDKFLNAVGVVEDFCSPKEDRIQMLGFSMRQPRQMFIHAELWSAVVGDEESISAFLDANCPKVLFGWLRRRWKRKMMTKFRIEQQERVSAFMHSAIGCMNVFYAGVNGLPAQSTNDPLDVFIVVGPGDEDGRIDTTNLEHTNPVVHFVYRGGHIEHLRRYDAEFERMMADLEREEKEAVEKEKKRVETLKKNGNPLAGTEFEGLLS